MIFHSDLPRQQILYHQYRQCFIGHCVPLGATGYVIAADAFRLLLADLHDHLCEAECLASLPGRWSDEDIDSVRKLSPDLLLMIRGLLIEHKMTPNGTCRTCPSAWPCPVVTTIHALVKDPDREFTAILHRTRDHRTRD